MNIFVRTGLESAFPLWWELRAPKFGGMRTSTKPISRGTVKGGRRQGRQRKRWEDNIRERTGLEFAKSQRAVENRQKWRKLVVKLSVVPQRPSWLGIDDDDNGDDDDVDDDDGGGDDSGDDDDDDDDVVMYVAEPFGNQVTSLTYTYYFLAVGRPALN